LSFLASHAGKQLDQAFLAFVDRLATAAGARWIRLDAWKDNRALHDYYLRSGFQHVRTVNFSHRGSGALFQRPSL
jgi:hypothetical protein